MDEKKVLKIIDENNNELEYEIILAFYWVKTNKNYVVYTDNKTDENNKQHRNRNEYDHPNGYRACLR